MKIKVFHGYNVKELEEQVNAFLVDRDVIDIRYNTDLCKTSYDKNESVVVDSILVLYN